jgi:RNA-directed DNA polymerase
MLDAEKIGRSWSTSFICSKSRRGFFQLQRKTRRDRMQAKLQEIKAELRLRMHQTIPDQGHWLKQVETVGKRVG